MPGGLGNECRGEGQFHTPLSQRCPPEHPWKEVPVTVIEFRFGNRCCCKGGEDVGAFEEMVLHDRFINLIHKLGFVFGIGTRRVEMFWLTRECIVIDVATGFVGAIRIVGTSSEVNEKRKKGTVQEVCPLLQRDRECPQTVTMHELFLCIVNYRGRAIPLLQWSTE